MSRLPGFEEGYDEEEEDEIGETEESDIIAQQRDKKSDKYEDPSFPASRASLYRNHHSVPEYDKHVREVTWLRPEQISKDPDYFKSAAQGAVSVAHGQLDDSWLLGALAAVAAHPSGLIENLFLSERDDFKTFGVYTCRFYKNGEWHEVVADTRVPCATLGEGADLATGSLAPGTPAPLYGRGVDLNEQWVPLLEKAYAKLHGSYEALNGGNVGEALVDLTGGCCETVLLTDDAIRRMADDGRLWDKLSHFLSWRYVLACIWTDPVGPHGPGGASSSSRGLAFAPASSADHAGGGSGIGGGLSGGDGGQSGPGGGLLPNHAYGVMDARESGGFRLVRVRNPWSKGVWEGDWSEGSPLWDDYPEVGAALSSDPLMPWQRNACDGTFWMSFKDFCRRFNQV
ncbi:unnamed protein product, partial [Phaeothamnion confervicola]